MSPRPIEFPVEGLSDGVVRLRMMSDADLPAMTAALRNPEIPGDLAEPAVAEETDRWRRMATMGLGAGTDLPTLVVGPEDDALLGAVALRNIDPQHGRCTAGYWVAAARRGQGVGRRSLRLLCRFAFEDLGVQRIELWIEPVNAASLRLAESVGFRREGLLRSFMRIDGERRDMLMYSLLPGETRFGSEDRG